MVSLLGPGSLRPGLAYVSFVLARLAEISALAWYFFADMGSIPQVLGCVDGLGCQKVCGKVCWSEYYLRHVISCNAVEGIIVASGL